MQVCITSSCQRSRSRSPCSHTQQALYAPRPPRSPHPPRNDHDMRRDDSSSRGRLDVDDRWRMNDSSERYSYDRRDDQRRGGDSHDAREGEGRTRHGYNDVRNSPSARQWLRKSRLVVFSTSLCRTPLGGHQHAATTTVQAATAALRKTTVTQAVILVTTTISGMNVGKGIRETGRETMVGSLGDRPRQPRVGLMNLLHGVYLAMVSPLIERIVLGSRLRRGSPDAVKEDQAPRPISGTRTQVENPS